jgi:glycosyltransferase involved in cell wall biosynthesis
MELKIAQITPYYYPSIGGVQGVVQYLSEELVKLGHKVDVLTSDRDHNHRPKLDRPHKEIINGVQIFRYKSFFNLGHMSFMPGLFNHLRRNKYNVLHYHNYRHPHCEIAAYIGKRKKSVSILHGHGPFFETGEISKLKNKVYTIYDKHALNSVFKNSDKIIALNNYEAKRYYTIGVPAEKVIVIPNAAEKDCFLPVDYDSFLNKYKLHGKKIILFVGILNIFKRPDLLIEALPEIIKNIPDAHLVLVGPDGGMLRKVNETAQRLKMGDYFSWIGPLYGIEKQQAYASAKLLVLPSDWDAYPLVLLEALARRLPIISTDTRGPIDIIDDNVTGFIIKKGDVDSLSKKIIRILNDWKLHKKMSDNAYQKALHFYSADSITKEIENLYFKLYELKK